MDQYTSIPFQFSKIDVDKVLAFEDDVKTHKYIIASQRQFSFMKKQARTQRGKFKSIFQRDVDLLGQKIPSVAAVKRSGGSAHYFSNEGYYHHRRCQYGQEVIVRVNDSQIFANQYLLTGSMSASPVFRSQCDMLPRSSVPKEYRVADKYSEALKRLYYNATMNKSIFRTDLDLQHLYKDLKIFRSYTSMLYQLAHFSYTIDYNFVSLPPTERYTILIETVNLIFSAINGHVIETCPGTFFLAPPGMGKTHFMCSHPFGFIDTDFFDPAPFNEDAKARKLLNLLASGFTIISNRWDWEKIAYRKYAVVAIFPGDLKKSLESKDIYSRNEARLRRDKAKFFSETGSKTGKTQATSKPLDRIQYNQEEWLNAYKAAPSLVNYIVASTFSEGYHKYLVSLFEK